MKRAHLLAALILVAVPGLPRLAHAEDSETVARRGTRLYEEGKYEEAAEAFRLARELAQREGERPPVFDYNLGTAYARQGEFDRAVETLEEAASVPESEDAPSVRERAWYNLGVSSARKAEELRQQGESQLQAEYETLQQALDAFRQSLILDPEDESARHNYALTQQRLKEIESQMQEQQQQQQEQQQDGGDPSEQQGAEGQNQEQQPSQEDPSGESGGAEEPTQGDSQQSQDQQSQPSETSQENQDTSSRPESGDKSQSEREQQASPESGEEQPREKEDADKSRDREEEQPASSEQQQRGGLEATPTPTPGAAQSPPKSQQGKRNEKPSDGLNRPPGNTGGADGADELTPEQLDALRVLNSLEEGEPEQFKKLFRFRGGEGRNLERDW